MNNMFPIVEAFTSIQGEGPFCGYPAFFLRVKKCNLYGKCLFECDTYKRIRYLNESFIPYDLICQSLKVTKHLVITGGEPTLYVDNIVHLIKYITVNIDDDIKIEVETNGHKLWELANAIDSKICKLYFNYSPKVLDANNVQSLVEDVVKLGHNIIVKIVVFDNEDVVNLVKRLSKSKVKDKVWLMPFGDTYETLNKNWPLVRDLSITQKLKVTSRLHIYASAL